MRPHIFAVSVAAICLCACAPKGLPDDVDVHASPSQRYLTEPQHKVIEIDPASPLAPYKAPERILIEPHQEDCHDKTIVIGERDNHVDDPQQRERVVTMTCEDEPGKAPYHEVLPEQPKPEEHHLPPAQRHGKRS